MTVPGYGRRPRGVWEREPRRTPSTCRSIHQTPGMPRRHHWLALRRTEPAGRNWTRVSQRIQKVARRGMRRVKRKRCQGRRRGMVGAGIMGKKGAMPEPGDYCS